MKRPVQSLHNVVEPLHMPLWGWIVLAVLTALLVLPWAIYGYVTYWDWIFGHGSAAAFWLPLGGER